MRVLLRWIGILSLLSGGVRAGEEAGITARFLPDRVLPGDVFELRVEMDRAEYARFELRVPPQDRLHRIAVEMEPVALEDGRYRQRESWLLQADRSGELIVDGVSVALLIGDEEVVVDLPPLRLDVLSYAEDDTSAEPVALPIPKQASAVNPGVIWGGAASVVAVLGFFIWLIRTLRQPAATCEPEGPSVAETAVAELQDGRVPTEALEWLMDTNGAEWPRELREAVGQMVYARRGDPGRLAKLLEQEVAR